jgi:hypothetical protein
VEELPEKKEPAEENNLVTITIRVPFKTVASFLTKHATPTLSILSAILAFGGLSGGYAWGKSATPAIADQVPASGPAGGLAIVPQVNFDPAANTLVQHCITVSGTASFPTGDEVWVIVHNQSPSIYYLEGAATATSPEPDGLVNWRFDNLVVGSSNEPGAKYQLVAVVLTEDVASYLNALTIIEGAGATVSAISDSAAAPQLPPDVEAQDTIDVTRDSSPENCPN